MKLVNTTNNPYISLNSTCTVATLSKPGQPVYTTNWGCEECGRPLFTPIKPALCMCKECKDARWP